MTCAGPTPTALGIARDMCARALWLEHGRVQALDDARVVANAYEAAVTAG